MNRHTFGPARLREPPERFLPPFAVEGRFVVGKNSFFKMFNARALQKPPSPFVSGALCLYQVILPTHCQCFFVSCLVLPLM